MPISSEAQAIRSAGAAVLSIAIQQMFPRAVITSTDVDDIGFSCEFSYPDTLDSSILPLVEGQMISLVHQDLELTSSEMVDTNLQEFYRYHGQRDRADYLDAEGLVVDVVRIGDFLEVVPGPHVDSLRRIKAIKLLSLEIDGTFFTVTGVTFGSKQELKHFTKLAEKAERCDHRRLGRELGLYDTHSGSYFWAPKGQIVRELLLDWWRSELRSEGFQFISTPTLVDEELPSSRASLHAQLFAKKLHSYRELPIRYAECAPVLDSKGSHDTLGLFRQPVYYSDEQTVVCRKDQVVGLLISSLQTINKTITLLGLKCRGHRYKRGNAFAGTLAQWDKATRYIDEALAAVDSAVEWQVETPAGLTGPRLEFRFLDALEREWRGPSLCFDFALPEELGLRYQGKQDEMEAPLVLIRTLFGSFERTIALLVEHYAGSLPLWLAPEQIRVLPVSEEQRPYALQVCDTCRKAGLRAEVDERDDRLAAKVFAAEAAKVPFIAIVGEQEARGGMVTVRTGQRRQHGDRVSVDSLVALAQTKTKQDRSFFESQQTDQSS
ncbi:MAG: threonine--tRNA ligase [Chlamydiales bacterium]|nr:threonine--tRNA ligase [Chlamydiales bacterium]